MSIVAEDVWHLGSGMNVFKSVDKLFQVETIMEVIQEWKKGTRGRVVLETKLPEIVYGRRLIPRNT